MRSYTSAEEAVFASSTYAVHARAYVANADGVMVDLTTVGGVNWFDRIDIDTTLDQPVSEAQITLRRGAGGTLSLSPFRTDSTLNRNAAAAYAPLLDLGRRVQVDVATTAVGTLPLAGDWKTIFVGTIDTIGLGSDPITISARDLGGLLVDTSLESDTDFGSNPGRALELVMQDVLDAALGTGVVTLFTPTSPGALATTYKQKSGPVMDILRTLASTIGWDVRYAWDNGTATYRLTFSEPPRNKTIADYTYGPYRYLDVTRMALDRTNIRNAIVVEYPVTWSNGNKGTERLPALIDTNSVAKYGRRFMLIREGERSPINTQEKAQALATAALSDLKAPAEEQEIELHFDWRPVIGDLFGFNANGVHYDTIQTLAVTSVRHTIDAGKTRTRLGTRGSPAGSYLGWISAGPGGPNGPPVGAPQNPTGVITAGDDPGDLYVPLTFDAIPGVGGTTAFDFTVVVKRGGTTTLTKNSVTDSLTLPYTYVFRRDYQMALVATLNVTDRLTLKKSAPVSYTIEAERAYIDTTGRVRRGVALDDGQYAVRASNTNGSTIDSGVGDSAGRGVNRFFAKGLTGDPDNLGSVADDSVRNYYRTTQNQRDGGGRAFGALDTGGIVVPGSIDLARPYVNKHMGNIPDDAASDRRAATANEKTGGSRGFTALDINAKLQTAVLDTAVVGDVEVRRLTRQSGRYFSETFDSLPGYRYAVNTAGTVSLVAGVGSVGKNVLQITGTDIRYLATPLPYNPTFLYRLRARFRQTVDNTLSPGGSEVYLGLVSYDAAGTQIGGYLGNYILVRAYTALVANGWREVTAWVKGAGNSPNTNPSDTPSDVPTSPATLYAGTVAVSPMWIFNYSPGNGTAQFDYFQIDEFDEDAAARIYGVISPTATIRANIVVANGGAERNMASGRQTFINLVHGASLPAFSGGSYSNPPSVRLFGGVSYEPGSVWSTSDPGASAGTGAFGALAPNGNPMVQEIQIVDLTATTGTVRARLRQTGTPVSRSDAFPTGNVTTVGGYSEVTTVSAPAVDDTYTATFDYSFLRNYPGGTASIQVVVTLDYWSGTTWVTLTSGTYAASDVDTAVASGTGATLTGAVTGRTSTSRFRLAIQSASGTGTGQSLTLTPISIRYVTSGSDQYANASRAGVNVQADLLGAT